MTDATQEPEASLIQQRISLERRRLIALVLMIVFLLLVGGQLVLMAYEGCRWYVIVQLVVLGRSSCSSWAHIGRCAVSSARTVATQVVSAPRAGDDGRMLSTLSRRRAAPVGVPMIRAGAAASA